MRKKDYRRVPPRPPQRNPYQTSGTSQGVRPPRRRSSKGPIIIIGVVVAGLLLFALLMIAIFVFILFGNDEDGNTDAADTTQVSESVSVNDEPVDSEVESVGDEDAADLTSELYYYHNVISDEDREIYDLVFKGIINQDETITLPAGSEEKLPNIVLMIWNDHPEIFWIDGAYSYLAYSDKTDVNMNYIYSESEVSTRKTEIESAGNDFNSTISSSDTEYDIIKKAYLYVIDTVEYVDGSSDNQNIYSAFVNKESVCTGYSRALQYLLQLNGIQSICVYGMSNSDSGWGDHAWNIVRCNDKYYNVDTTYGDNYSNIDEKMEELGIRNYAYLCIDDDTLGRNHQADESLTIPKCESSDLNYYALNGIYSDTFDEQVLENMRESVFGGEHFWAYQFSNYEAYSECLESIEDSSYVSMVAEYLNSDCRATHINDDVMYVIHCWY